MVNVTVAPKRIAVFIRKSPLSLHPLSRVLGIRTLGKTSYSRMAERKNAKLEKRRSTQHFIRRGKELIAHDCPDG